jgi:hypothetical protein
MHDEFERAHRQGNIVMVVVLLMVSLPCLLGTGYMLSRSIGFALFADRAEGRIVETGSGTPELTVEYTTSSGQARKVVSAGSDLYANYAVGDRVRVLYDADQPADARLDLFVEQWMLPLILGVFGSFFFVPVLLMGGSALRGLLRRGNLDRDGLIVQAQYTGFRFALDAKSLRQRQGGIGTVQLLSQNDQHQVFDNGRLRDPHDPLVQKELGLRFIVQAQWTDPQTGRTHRFESEPQAENPERRVRADRVAVRVNPKYPAQYRFEPPFGPSAAAPMRSSVIE